MYDPLESAGKATVSDVVLLKVTDLLEPLTVTVVDPDTKLLPFIVILPLVPPHKLPGLKELIVGGAVYANTPVPVADPYGVVIVTFFEPLVEMLGIVMVSDVELLTVTVAATPSTVAVVLPPTNPVPVTVAVVPVRPLDGDIDVYVGGLKNVRASTPVAEPYGVVIVIFFVPAVAWLGTVIVSDVVLLYVVVAEVPPTVTVVFPATKFVPVIVTEVPVPTLVGVALEYVGAP